MRHRTATALFTVLLAAVLAGCGDDDGADDNASGSASASASVAAVEGDEGDDHEASAGDGDYEPVSDVDAHAAIGGDIAAIKDLLAAAKEGAPVDWDAVGEVYEGGGASVKGDGTNRTLATLVGAPDVADRIEAAIAGTGELVGSSDGVRAQHVDKGISVLLQRKVVDELAAAQAKLADDDTDPASGAPHNVDEAWAFFTAEGNGLAATADKRAADFEREGEVREPVVTALAAAQQASLDGDGDAFAEAAAEVDDALAYIFYLATHKYLDADDEVGLAEGAAFYAGIQPRVAAASPEADATITAAFAGDGSSEAGQEALHRPEVLEALAVDDEQREDD
ncbi:MAG: hypothetical protein WD232_11020 [Acidimicrobiales bacterium]